MSFQRLATGLRLLLLSIPAVLSAAEVDSFTGRHALADAGPFLNQVVNVWMEEAVVEANRPPLLPALQTKAQGCDRDRLMKALEDRLAGYLVGQLEDFAENSTAIETIRTPLERSIYRDFDFTESPTVALTRRLGVLLRIGDVYLGSDKLGHFFTEGRTYLDHYVEGGERSVLRYGDLTEHTYYGGITTGIYSYADLAANLNGLRFWNAVFAEHPDPLHPERPVRPYMRCEQGRWHRVRAFDWNDYVDPAWDEALNCNAYSDPRLLRKATRRIAEATGGACPLASVPLAPLERKYGPLLDHVFNRQGPQVLESFATQFGRYWEEILNGLSVKIGN